MKHKILNYAGDLLGTIDITPERAAEIAAAKAEVNPRDESIYSYLPDTWHFIAGDWLTDSEIEALGTSHELEVQIIPGEEGASGPLACDGSCEQHDGEVRKVHVLSIKTKHDWGTLNYCAAAIAEDEKRGLTVVAEGGNQ